MGSTSEESTDHRSKILKKKISGVVGELGIKRYKIGLAMRSRCVALGTVSRHLGWSKIMCEIERVHACVTGSPCCPEKNIALGK